MSYIGHCNCARIRISLAQKPSNSVLCHCSNCKRAGGPFSVNFFVSEHDITVEDPTGSLKVYGDTKTQSGNEVQRNFCSNCGSPIMSKSRGFPGQAFLKASLFDEIPPPAAQVHTGNQEGWLHVDESAPPSRD